MIDFQKELLNTVAETKATYSQAYENFNNACHDLFKSFVNLVDKEFDNINFLCDHTKTDTGAYRVLKARVYFSSKSYINFKIAKDRANDGKLAKVLSVAVDFVDDEKPIYRVYNDSFFKNSEGRFALDYSATSENFLPENIVIVKEFNNLISDELFTEDFERAMIKAAENAVIDSYIGEK